MFLSNVKNEADNPLKYENISLLRIDKILSHFQIEQKPNSFDKRSVVAVDTFGFLIGTILTKGRF